MAINVVEAVLLDLGLDTKSAIGKRIIEAPSSSRIYAAGVNHRSSRCEKHRQKAYLLVDTFRLPMELVSRIDVEKGNQDGVSSDVLARKREDFVSLASLLSFSETDARGL